MQESAHDDDQAVGEYVRPLLSSQHLTVSKAGTIGVADNNKFAGGDGSDQFINQSLVANPLMVPQIPLSAFLVGAVMPQEWGNISQSVMDLIERSMEFMDSSSLFESGALNFGHVLVDTDYFSKPGERHLGCFH